MRVHWIRNMNKQATFAFDRIHIPYTLIWIVLDGDLLVGINGEQHWLSRGHLIMCPPNTQFELIPRQTTERIHYLSLCADLKIGNMDIVSLYNLPTIAKLDDTSAISNWVEQWKKLVIEFDSFGQLVESKLDHDGEDHTYFLHTDIPIQYCGLQGSIYQWVKTWMNNMRPMLPVEPLRFDSRVMKVCDFIRDRLEQPLNLQDLAAYVHLSVSQLSHLFIETIGTSPMEFVRKSRINYAKQLLMNKSYSLREIAEKIGYEDQSQLSRAFKKAEGLSPSEYRKKVTLSRIN